MKAKKRMKKMIKIKYNEIGWWLAYNNKDEEIRPISLKLMRLS